MDRPSRCDSTGTGTTPLNSAGFYDRRTPRAAGWWRRPRRSDGPAARVDPPAAVGGYRLLTPHDPVAGRVRQEGEGVDRPDARVTRGGTEAVPHAIRGHYGMDLRRRRSSKAGCGTRIA